MGYLNNQIVTVDAILTRKGRELLARNDGSFRITQFAVSDDEIDYTLYNPNHPSGSSFYGEAIENMPLLEAFPQETQIMKYRLTTLPRGTAKLPVIKLGFSNISISQGESFTLNPQTLNFLGNASLVETSGYAATIADVRVLSTFTGGGVTNAPANNNVPINQTIGTNLSRTVVGTTFNISGTTVNTLYSGTTELRTTITIVGLDSGTRLTIPLTVNQI